MRRNTPVKYAGWIEQAPESLPPDPDTPNPWWIGLGSLAALLVVVGLMALVG